jgi:hypothetical protein
VPKGTPALSLFADGLKCGGANGSRSTSPVDGGERSGQLPGRRASTFAAKEMLLKTMLLLCESFW